MKKLALLFASIFVSGQLHAETTLIHNVNGYTINQGKLTQFSAIQFTDDTVDNIFSAKPASIAADVNVIDAGGQNMLPGLIDAHGHVLGYGESLMTVDLVNSESEEEAVSRVIKYQKANPSQAWIQGRGWNQVQWPSKSFPTAKSLDKYFPDTPVFLVRVDGHADRKSTRLNSSH